MPAKRAQVRPSPALTSFRALAASFTARRYRDLLLIVAVEERPLAPSRTAWCLEI
jgi:hypothetical protein